MSASLRVGPDEWYEMLTMGDGVTLIHEPWIKPFYRCNMWHVRGRNRDLLFDSGLGHFSLRKHVALVRDRPILCVASHAHFDHIGGHHEFVNRAIHPLEADILAHPTRKTTTADPHATDQMFMRQPMGWDQRHYLVQAAPATQLVREGDIIDLGDRSFEVIHTPGHSPGGIGLFERRTGILLSGDVIYDGPLIDDAYHSDRVQYAHTFEALGRLKVSIVHGGHFPSFGPVRYRQLIEEYLESKRAAGCHLARTRHSND